MPANSTSQTALFMRCVTRHLRIQRTFSYSRFVFPYTVRVVSFPYSIRVRIVVQMLVIYYYQDALRLFNVCVQRKQQLSPDDSEPASAETATQTYVPGSHPVIAKVAELIKSLFILLDKHAVHILAIIICALIASPFFNGQSACDLRQLRSIQSSVQVYTPLT